jgi:hypothetical protein
MGTSIEFMRYGDSKASTADVVWAGEGEIDRALRPVALVVDNDGRDAAVYQSADGEWCDAADCWSRDWVSADGNDPDAETAKRIDDALNLRS